MLLVVLSNIIVWQRACSGEARTLEHFVKSV